MLSLLRADPRYLTWVFFKTLCLVTWMVCFYTAIFGPQESWVYLLLIGSAAEAGALIVQ